MRRGKGLMSIALLVMTLGSCAPAQRTNEDQDVYLPDDRAARSTTAPDSLRCTDRATIPQIEHVTNAKWSADSSGLAVSRIVTVPSSVTISGYEEDVIGGGKAFCRDSTGSGWKSLAGSI